MMSTKSRQNKGARRRQSSGFWGGRARQRAVGVSPGPKKLAVRAFLPDASQPQLGRFLSRDPIGFKGGLNQYSYAMNNPVGLVDPAGLAPSCPSKLKVTIIVGAGYTDEYGAWHQVATPDGSKITGGASIIGGSSWLGFEGDGANRNDFIQALQNTDIFEYIGHINTNGRIHLSDGWFTIASLLMAAGSARPKYVVIDACHSGQFLPSIGQFPGTIFIGLGQTANLSPALDFAVGAANALQTDQPLPNLNQTTSYQILVTGQPPSNNPGP